MRTLIVILALLAIFGCASKNTARVNTGDVVTGADATVIALDFAALEDKQAAHIYLAYSIARSIWEPVYLKDGSPDLFAREVYARDSMLQVWKEGSANEAHPVLDKMTLIRDAGYLRELIWVQYHDAFSARPTGLDLEGLKQWLAEHPGDEFALK